MENVDIILWVILGSTAGLYLWTSKDYTPRPQNSHLDAFWKSVRARITLLKPEYVTLSATSIKRLIPQLGMLLVIAGGFTLTEHGWWFLGVTALVDVALSSTAVKKKPIKQYTRFAARAETIFIWVANLVSIGIIIIAFQYANSWWSYFLLYIAISLWNAIVFVIIAGWEEGIYEQDFQEVGSYDRHPMIADLIFGSALVVLVLPLLLFMLYVEKKDESRPQLNQKSAVRNSGTEYRSKHGLYTIPRMGSIKRFWFAYIFDLAVLALLAYIPYQLLSGAYELSGGVVLAYLFLACACAWLIHFTHTKLSRERNN